MVRQSETGSNDLKRKSPITDVIRAKRGHADVTERKRLGLGYEPETDEDYEEEDDAEAEEGEEDYSSGTDDEGSSLTDAASPSTSSSDTELEDDTESGTTTRSSRNSPVNQSSEDGSISPRSLDSDPDRTRDDRKRNKRKPSRPMKSPNPEDPKFKGVTVQFRTVVNNGEVQLLITAFFNCRKVSRRRCSWKTGCTSPSSNTETSDTSLVDLTSSYGMRRGKPGQVYHPSGKQCASCCTRKTPLWRDAEDGTPLCNACGIRYKKYRVRCGHCWFVPKKESKTNQICSNCGERFRFSMLRFKHSII